jgi:disulfide bond formation protein DsbB
MWFCAMYAIGAVIGIIAVFLDLGRLLGGYSIGGMPVSREKWLEIAAPLVAMITFLMGATALALKKHRSHARIIFMLIWLLIIIYGVTCAVIHAVPWKLGLRAVIDATFVGAIAAWLLFKYKPSRTYFAELRR